MTPIDNHPREDIDDLIKDAPTVAEFPFPENSYYQHEAWFELRKIKKQYKDDKAIGLPIEGVLIVNSYGRVREVWENGEYKDLHAGKGK